MRAFHARPFTCRSPNLKNGFFTQIRKHKVLRQARFFRWLRFHLSRSRARFPGWQPGEAGHGNGFGGVSPPPSAVSAWKPRDPRFPGVLCPSTAGCRVVDLPAVSAPLLSRKPAACLPSFSIIQDRCGILPSWCRCGLLWLAVKNRPVLVTWFLFTN